MNFPVGFGPNILSPQYLVARSSMAEQVPLWEQTSFVYVKSATSWHLYWRSLGIIHSLSQMFVVSRGRIYILEDYRLGFWIWVQCIDYCFSPLPLGKRSSLISVKFPKCLKWITCKFCTCTGGKANICELKIHLFASIIKYFNKLLQSIV